MWRYYFSSRSQRWISWSLATVTKINGSWFKDNSKWLCCLKSAGSFVTKGLEDDSGKKVDTTESFSDEEDTDSSSSDHDKRDASNDDDSSDDDKDTKDTDTDTEEEGRNSRDERDDENEDKMEVDNVVQYKGDYWDFDQ